MASDFFRHRPVSRSRQGEDRLPARPGGCLFKTGHSAMNEPKADSPGRGQERRGVDLRSGRRADAAGIGLGDSGTAGLCHRDFSRPGIGAPGIQGRRAAARPDHHRLRDAHDDRLGIGGSLPADSAEAKGSAVSGTVGPEVFHNAPVKPDRFLAKPYQAKQLVDAVRSMLAD